MFHVFMLNQTKLDQVFELTKGKVWIQAIVDAGGYQNTVQINTDKGTYMFSKHMSDMYTGKMGKLDALLSIVKNTAKLIVHY